MCDTPMESWFIKKLATGIKVINLYKIYAILAVYDSSAT
jgi:hypothetical protein